MVVVQLLLLVWSISGSLAQHPALTEDPCSTYKALSNESRSIFEYSSQCYADHDINGWYRFIGKAGNGMLDYAPTASTATGGSYRCGAAMLGYLLDRHPKKYEGIVPRTVCFIYGNSNCWTSRTIHVKSCGDFFVYKLSALPRTYFMRYCGNGEMRELGNFSLQVTAYMNNAFKNPIKRYPVAVPLRNTVYLEVNANVMNSSLQLLVQRCYVTPTKNIEDSTQYNIIDEKCVVDPATNFIPAASLARRFNFQMLRFENSYLIYIHCLVSFCRKHSTDPRCRGGCNGNRIDEANRSEVSSDADGGIDYAGPYNVSTGGFYVQYGIGCAGNRGGFGNLSFHFNTYKTNALENPIQNFPVEVKLRDWLYFEVNATVEDSILALIIERCYLTPTMDHEDSKQYKLIDEKCPVDASTSFMQTTGLRRRFSMQVSKHFNASTFYIHCFPFLCHKNSATRRCKTGCTGNNIFGKKRRDLSAVPLMMTKSLILSTGKFVFRKRSTPIMHRTDPSFPTINLIFGGMVALALTLIILVMALLIQRRAPPGSYGRQGNEIGMGNVVMEYNGEP